MGIPRTYRKSEKTITTYDFYDLAAGAGIKRFYGIDCANGVKSLIQNTMSGEEGITNNGNGGTGNFDFDLEFQKTIKIKGPCYVNIPFVLWNGSGGVSATGTTAVATLYHVDNDLNETSLGSVSATWTSNAGGMSGYFKSLVGKIDITQTSFKDGEKLRLNITTTSPGGSRFVYMGHDPQNDLPPTPIAGIWETTQLKVDIPILLNL